MDLKSKIILIYGATASGKTKFGIKLTSNPSIDLGQGLLELIKEIDGELKNEK